MQNAQDIVNHYQAQPVDALKARLAKIIPVIKILSREWQRQDLSAAMVLQWKVDDLVYQSAVIDAVETCCQDTLRQFIHDFCTHLCAEKQIIEGLLIAQDPVNL